MTLHLTLFREYFVKILNGDKKIEYRENKPYWNKKFMNNKYELICFRNGYSRNAPTFLIELLFIKAAHDCWELHLGKIISTKNLIDFNSQIPMML